jgi:hypothetical protein
MEKRSCTDSIPLGYYYMPRATGPFRQDVYFKTKNVATNTLVKQADRGP